MNVLLIPLMFGMSAFLLFWYFGALMHEKRMLNKRIRMLQDGVVTTAASKEKLFKDDFSKKTKRAENRRIENQPQFLLFMALWMGVGAIFLQRANMGFSVSVIVLVIIPLLTVRIIRILMKRSRIERIQRELPGALDLMVVCLEAGLAINSALLRIANEMEGSPLGKELRRASDEVAAGIPLEDALRGFAKRTEIEDVNTIVTAIIQAEKMGSSLALTFRIQSETLREKYKMSIKEKINRVPIKIIFPLVFFLFPALFVVILGPSIIFISETLQDI